MDGAGSAAELVMQYFAAPWSPTLKVTTGVLLVLCLLTFLSAGPIAGSLALGVIVFALVFSVRGYSVGEGGVLIHHPGWSRRVDLADLVSVEEAPEGLFPSVRAGGIGGLFSSVGFFRSSLMGPYRAWATDWRRAVLLDMGEGKIVVTPDRPSEFAAAVRLHRFHVRQGNGQE